MSVNYRGDAVKVVRCVEVANLVCTLKGISSVGLPLVKCSRPTLAALSLSPNSIASLATDLDEELADNASLLHI